MDDEQFNTDELVPPEWLGDQFFQNILRESENDSGLVINEIIVRPASKKGEHFASIMFRVRVNFTSNSKDCTTSLIVKTMPFVESLKKEMLRNSPIFDIEMKMYGETIPAMERLLRSIGDKTQFGGRMVYCSKVPCDVIVFEDLCEIGYVVPKGQMGFGATKMVYETMAKWHATTLYLAEVEKINFSSYNMNMFKGSLGPSIETFLHECLMTVLNTLKDWDKFEQYEANLIEYIKNIKTNGIETYKPNPPQQGYNVLNHGDLHAKNLMIKYHSNGDIDNILLVS